MEDRYQLLFLGGSALLVLVQAFRGWRLGVVRQLVNLGALLLAYGFALLCGRLATPIFHPLGYPDLLVSALVGSVVGCLVYFSVAALGRILFRRTDQQSLGLVRLGYGAGGSFLGMLGGLVTVWLLVLGIRFLGTAAEAEVNLARRDHGRSAPPASEVAVQLAHLKRSLDSGTTGAVISSMDPIPARSYVIVNKITKVLSSVESMNRFVSFPGTRTLGENPRILALRQDPEILRHVQKHDFLGLLSNAHIVAALNDPQVSRLVREFELEKALDYALGITEKNGPARAGRVPLFMAQQYIATIGLEVHVQLRTRSKMFCGCPVEYGAPPNAHTCPICLGLPGALPAMNGEALKMTALTGLMLGCQIAEVCKFDRKNYFYPDMPKNYQISQYDRPICLGGQVPLPEWLIPRTRRNPSRRRTKRCRSCASTSRRTWRNRSISRAAPASISTARERRSWRSSPSRTSIPRRKRLPISPRSSRSWSYGDVSDADMEKGQLRCDCNVSVRPAGQTELGTKIEIKNMNTISGVRRALAYEIERQIGRSRRRDAAAGDAALG